MDDSDENVRVRTEDVAWNQRRRTTESSVSESEEYVSDSGATQSKESMQDLARKLVRYALSCEYSRTPIRRADIGTKILAGGNGRQFKEVFAQAQFMLETTWGMKMEELPVREKVTNAQKRGMMIRSIAIGFALTQREPRKSLRSRPPTVMRGCSSARYQRNTATLQSYHRPRSQLRRRRRATSACIPSS